MKRWHGIGLAAAACALAVAAILLGFTTGLFLPAWIEWEQADLSGDVQAGEPERIVLKNGTVRVLHQGEVLWQSDRAVRVQSVLWCDIDHDGARELMLLCWKRGRYGQSRPFWVKEDEKTWSQHIFLYDCTAQEGIRPLWMASDIGMEATGWRFDEQRRLVLTDRQGGHSAWDWVSWGLSSIPLTEPQPSLSFAVLGENLIHRQIYHYAFTHWDGRFNALFDGVREELARYDVTCIHQEGLYVEDRGDFSSYPLFGTPVQVGQALIDEGFDIVSCAGNHALDKGVAAIDRTAALFRDADVTVAGIQPTSDGAYRPYELFERNGLRVAVLGYTQSTNGHALPEQTPFVLHTLDDEAQVQRDLAAAAAEADILLVFVHWGTEYSAQPDAEQRRWAQVFADGGATVVLGTHPHVQQPVEWVDGAASNRGAVGNRTLVYYSLGNFISAQTDEACRRGGLAHFTITLDGESCSVTDYGLTQLLTTQDNGLYATHLVQEP